MKLARLSLVFLSASAAVVAPVLGDSTGSSCFLNSDTQADCLTSSCYWCTVDGYKVCVPEDEADGAKDLPGVTCIMPQAPLEELARNRGGEIPQQSRPAEPRPQQEDEVESTWTQLQQTDYAEPKFTRTVRRGESLSIYTCQGGQGLMGTCCAALTDWENVDRSCQPNNIVCPGSGMVSCQIGLLDKCVGGSECSIKCGTTCLVQGNDDLKPAAVSVKVRTVDGDDEDP